MPIERDGILQENLRGSLAAYERSVLGAMTASAAFFLLSLRLDSTSSVAVWRAHRRGGMAYCARVLLPAWRIRSFGDSKIGGALRALDPTGEVRRAIARSFSQAV